MKFDYKRIMNHSRVIDDKICFRENTYQECTDIFQSRLKLFSKVYTHRVSDSVELMISDAILNAKDLFDIPNCMYENNLDSYIKLTDEYVLNSILYSGEQ